LVYWVRSEKHELFFGGRSAGGKKEGKVKGGGKLTDGGGVSKKKSGYSKEKETKLPPNYVRRGKLKKIQIQTKNGEKWPTRKRKTVRGKKRRGRRKNLSHDTSERKEVGTPLRRGGSVSMQGKRPPHQVTPPPELLRRSTILCWGKNHISGGVG